MFLAARVLCDHKEKKRISYRLILILLAVVFSLAYSQSAPNLTVDSVTFAMLII